MDSARFHLNVPGLHNVLNATAAVAVGLEMELSPRADSRRVSRSSAAWTAGSRFAGRTRGHGGGRLRSSSDRNQGDVSGSPAFQLPEHPVLFQPHRFTRTKHLLEDFGTAFHQADDVYLLDIYAASEQTIEGISGEALADKVRSYGHRSVHYVATIGEGIDAIVAAAEPGDLIVTLGAGSISQAADKILERLKGAADGTAA